MNKIYNHTSSSIQLLKKEIQKFNNAHENYFVNFANRNYEKNKPFGNPNECADILYRMGMLFSGTKIGRSQKIGELGCGGGWLSYYISKLGNEVHLMDVSSEAIKISKELFNEQKVNKNVFFYKLKNDKINLADNILDRIVVHDAIHHIPNPDKILAECYRVLKNGGIMGLSECGPIHSKVPAIVDCVTKTGILERDLTFEDLKKISHNAGFSEIKIKPYISVNQLEIKIDDLEKLINNNQQIINNLDIINAFSAGDQTMAFLYKGKFNYDTTYPNDPRAKIELISKINKGKTTEIELSVENIGDTTFITKSSNLGGFCKLGCHLLDKNQKNLNFDFIHHSLENFDNIKPGDKISLKLSVRSDYIENYLLEFDIVIEKICWLAYMGSKTLKI